MSKSSFDQKIDRSGTNSIRWDKYGPDIIPLWVADMDFKPPQAVLDVLHARVDHGVLGYTYASEQLKEAIVRYVNKTYAWKIQKEWIAFLPSVVTGLHLSVRVLTHPSDHVLIPAPAYHHFKDSVEHQRDYSTYDLRLQDGRYTIDMSQLESLVRPNTRLLMMCNPHNPGGTVFTKAELELLAIFAKKHELIICSDEIHADLILDTNKHHTPIGSVGQGIDERSFSLMSLNKAYNFPGVGMAWVISQSSQIREALMRDVNTLIPHPHLFAYAVTQAALELGEDWHAELIDYLRANRDLVFQRINAMPGLSMAHLEATYLAWIDAGQLGNKNPFTYFLEAGVALSPGAQFGNEQFVRLNFGTQRKLLEQALDRMEIACKLL
jgi:aminotransferase/cystathionine beta-lyase